MKKTYIIGDIHGCYLCLDKLLDKLSPVAGKDTIITLGDMINRGPDSISVVDRLIRMRIQGHNIITLRGNHELMFLNYLAGKKQNFFLINGGDKTIKNYNITAPFSKNNLKKIPADHIDFFNNLLPYWQDEAHIYVHAGLKPGVKLAKQRPEWLYWSRNNFIDEQHKYPKQVIFGHTTFKEPLIQKNKVGIDTGAVYGGKLTCLILPDFKFISVDGLNDKKAPQQE